MARAGVMPLEQAENAIRHGEVRVDSRVQLEPLAPVTMKSRVEVDGQPVSLSWRTRVLMLHKPPGVVMHGKDPEGNGTVFDVLVRSMPAELQTFGWHAVGRLDRDTTGLLLFTNDEKFVLHATSPHKDLPKRYVARVGVKVTEKKLEPLWRGVKIDDGALTRPAIAKPRGEDSVELTLTEGRFHQVKRMLNAVNLPTLALHREAVGKLVVDIPERAVRELSDDEVLNELKFTPRHG
ncbi:MAG: rRNA pseudouridine synthase [Archangium gephyra]|uniref:Pseudouridine synthase n=1 Tax=Archangium gephyra TaxID=48 RepID=A0A2W5T0T7_9BACT|nr:MAG: rRNA pseudouridine synthase [Archangium gephyra]